MLLKKIYVSAAILLSLGIAVLANPIATSRAASTSHLAAQTIDSDAFDNYDFLSQSVASNNVDWPINLLFWNNANINKIKDTLNPQVTGLRAEVAGALSSDSDQVSLAIGSKDQRRAMKWWWLPPAGIVLLGGSAALVRARRG